MNFSIKKHVKRGPQEQYRHPNAIKKRISVMPSKKISVGIDIPRNMLTLKGDGFDPLLEVQLIY